MKLPKILLIAPTYINSANTMYFPIGMAYLCSYLEKKGFEIDGINMNNYGLEKGLEKVSTLLKSKKYDVIGIGGLTIAFEQIEYLIKKLRCLSDAKIVLGGGITACESEIVIKEIKPDYMIISEGELIFEELLYHIADIKKPLPKGSWSFNLNRSEIEYQNNESYSINELDELPFPDYEKMEIDKFIDIQSGEIWSHHKVDPFVGKYIPISASRSCPFKCTFCYHSGMGKYRKHSVDYATEFIKRLKEKYKITHFLIYDELFSLNKKRVIEFCEKIKKLNISFMCQLRVDQIDLEMLKTMKDAGCIEISYGIESGSNKVIESMQKKITAEQIENAIKLTREAKIGIQGNFLYGDPAETEETIKDSLKFQEKNKLYFSDWSMVLPYPGTVLHNIALSKNLINDRVQFIKDIANTSKYLWNSPINLTNFSDKEYIERYSMLKEINDKNHRKVLTKIIEAKDIDSKHSYLKVSCPTCNYESEYENFPFPFNKENLFKNKESFYGFLGINLVCPNCRSKHHLLPKQIPHISKEFKLFESKLKNFIKKNKNIVVMPAIDRYFSAIKDDTNLFNISVNGVLDSREYRIGDKFLNSKVEKLSKETILKYSNKSFIIYPWVEYEKAYNLLISNGIQKEKILMWNKI
ncbi:hypothetical protein CRU98_10685 [Arcobacter sp. CECT 8986]|uniref:B12-binding domain-containing radical SAM protein n=1 Tax=Arcobacter sp. CECT 8986 TaxID=2044507 RepID=UPI001009C60D|nr:radical SAM protein [Arcobacter sp. CECT 8986]RXJ98219.1 hypothetical protein CRU98_10685 [Arcobacter sp. CECT 8986]